MSLIITPDGFLFDDHKQLMVSCPKQPECYCTVDCALCLLRTEHMAGETSDVLIFMCGCEPIQHFLAAPYTPPEQLQKSQIETDAEEVDESQE